MLNSKIKMILIMLLAAFVLRMFTISEASAQESDGGFANRTVFVQDSVSEVQKSVTEVQDSELEADASKNLELYFGLGFGNRAALPGNIGINYRFTDSYRMGFDVQLALVLELFFKATWTHMFEFYRNDHIAFSAGAGIGYMAYDKIDLINDEDDEDDEWTGRKGIVFPASVALDYFTGDNVFFRVNVDLNNYIVVEDKLILNNASKPCHTPRYIFSYDVMFQAVIKL